MPLHLQVYLDFPEVKLKGAATPYFQDCLSRLTCGKIKGWSNSCQNLNVYGGTDDNPLAVNLYTQLV